jgi:hypothetical protein
MSMRDRRGESLEESSRRVAEYDRPISREDRDYRWRLSISRRDWIKLAGRLAETVQYDNFKSAVHRNPSQGSKSGSYLRSDPRWQTCNVLKRTATWSNVTNRTPPPHGNRLSRKWTSRSRRNRSNAKRRRSLANRRRSSGAELRSLCHGVGDGGRVVGLLLISGVVRPIVAA